MTKEQYLAKRQELMAQAEELLEQDEVEKSQEVATEVEALDKSFESFAKAQANMRALKDNPVIDQTILNLMGDETEMKNEVLDVKSARGEKLKMNNAVTVGSSSVLLATHESDTINPTFNQVSSLVDRVKVVVLPGGESFKQPYLLGSAEGGYTAEGDAYNTADTTFGYATIAKAKITAYSEESEEVMKLAPAEYDAAIVGGIRTSLRRKIVREILSGAGGTNQFVGIFDDGATAIDAATDLGISSITTSTLEDIIYNFGGDEEVEDAAVLLLSKKDLKAFAKLRTTDGKKFHDIVNNGNTGTIDGTEYMIVGAAKAVSDAGTAVGQYTMAYGPLSNYTMAVFSDLTVQRSNDYKFAQGMIAHKGDVFAGGNVSAKNGFLRVKKVAAV